MNVTPPVLQDSARQFAKRIEAERVNIPSIGQPVDGGGNRSKHLNRCLKKKDDCRPPDADLFSELD
jgi:hypothetical protein